MRRKQLRKKHHLEFEAGKLSELDVDYLKNLLNIPDGPVLRVAFAKGSASSRLPEGQPN